MEEHCRPHIQVSTPTGHHFAICGYFQDRNSTCNSLKPGPTVYIQQIGVSGFTSQNETLETPSQISKQVGIPLSLLFQPTFGKRKPCWDLLEPIQNSFVPGRHYFSQPVPEDMGNKFRQCVLWQNKLLSGIIVKDLLPQEFLGYRLPNGKQSKSYILCTI